MAKNLTDLTARTATEGSDLILVNSSGVDYKETKDNFLEGGLHATFATNSLLTTQVDNLPNGTWVGYCNASGHQNETGLPIDRSVHVTVIKRSNYYIDIEIKGAGQNDNIWAISKNNGTWASSWTRRPTRSEADELIRHFPATTTISSNSSATVTVAGSTRALLCVFGFSNEATNIFLVTSTSSQATYVVPLKTSSGMSTSVSGGSVTLTNSTGSNAYLYSLVFSGSVT